MRFLAFLSAICIQNVVSQVLQPPYFDIARGKPISATATCGEGPGTEEEGRELFCKLAEAPGRVAIQGQYCDYCYPGNHSIKFSTDGSEKWWQSPSLSRGLQYEDVNITINLGQMYHVAYIIIKAANSPRPGVWSLMRSVDGGKTFTPWYNFASTPSECLTYHKTSHLLPLTRDDTVLCKMEYSQVPPFEDGEIHISLVNGRPGAANFSFSPTLQEWTTATHIRLNFMKVKTLLGDLMPLSLQDPTVTRRYYYSIKEILVGGRCMCNGFAERCVSVDDDVSNYQCECQHNTCGARCDQCCPGYVQKKWKPRQGNGAFVCEPCNCHGHSSQCQYSEQVAQRKLSLDINGKREGGGVCEECQHNTYGINCEKCRPYYYRPEGVPITSQDACRPCNCSFQTSNGDCADGDGQCTCKPNYTGMKCDRCNVGFFNYPVCEECICDREGSVEGSCAPDTAGNCRCKPGYTGKFCNRCEKEYYGYPACRPCNCLVQYGALDNLCDIASGKCKCKPGYGSRTCDQCLVGYYNFPFCKQCDCDPSKTVPGICSAGSGVCRCKDNYSGLKCDRCADGFYGYPMCRPCDCSSTGSSSSPCDRTTGRCTCLPNFRGSKCDECVRGYYGYPACLSCSCDLVGSFGTSCRSSSGQCSCKSQFQGRQCNKCQPGYYGFPNCQRCQCNPAGTKSGPGGIDCSSTSNGFCPCKDNVQGKECTECKHGFFNMQASNPDGCSNCRCSRAGSLSGLLVCSKLTGQCTCKRHVANRACSECKDGFYGLKEVNLFGCNGCQCDMGGSVDLTCDKRSGQCKCRTNVIGRTCNKPRPGFYAPTLHQIATEIEDGRAPDGNVISFDVQESKFPGYSGRGYSMINEVQPTIIASVNVFKKSNYQIMFKYVLNQLTTVTGKVKVYPSGQNRGLFSGNIDFPTTQAVGSFDSKYAKLSKEGDPIFFPLAPGKWDIEITAPPSALLLDKVILIPEEYVDSKQLKKKVTAPCEVGKNQTVCNQFSYLNVKQQPDFITVEAEINSKDLPPVLLFNDSKVLKELDFDGMAKMSRSRLQLDIDIEINKNGNYVFVAQYYHDSQKPAAVDFYLRTYLNTQRGRLLLNRCTYKFGCRQVAVDDRTGTVKVFSALAGELKRVTFLSRSKSTIGIDSVIAIPVEKWNIDYVIPQLLCTTEKNKCTPATFPFPKKSVRVDGLASAGDPLPRNAIDPRSLTYVPSGSIRAIPKKKLPSGRYYIVVHYYQPENPSFDAQVSVDNVRAFPGIVNFNYCTHTSGCRTLVKNEGGTNTYTLAEAETSLRINVPEGKDVWVDYVMYIPESVFKPTDLMQNPTSRVSEFSEDCTKDDFYIKPSAQGFCRDSTFSLTTAFNNGTLPCNCDAKGSIDESCGELGGQCKCKSQHITGRTCNRCRMGYYGFPNCRACQKCNICDEITGECQCPPGVMGDRCDKCKPGTYGYDQVVGCRPCRCDKVGTKDANQTCNVATGQCKCRENFGGRQCAECLAGYFGRPACKPCSCNPTGITESKCDKETGKCLCKPSVTGKLCSQCVDGHFRTAAKKATNLCLKCWCSGRSKKCSESTRYRNLIAKSAIAKPWNVTHHFGKINLRNRVMTIQQTNESASSPVYWIAPKEYLSEGVLAYAGYFDFSLQFKSLPGYESFTLSEDVPLIIIQGLNSQIHYKRKLKMQDGVKINVRVPLFEDAWMNVDGSAVSRFEFLETIAVPKAVHIRASHTTGEKYESTLSPVLLSSSSETGVDRAHGIETCQCPKEYTGTSCEKCARGYTRSVGGSCVQCNCNGKTKDCDAETGVCNGCTENTMGDRCEKCKPGFYGDKCKPCECPMSSSSNNFATSCFLSNSGSMTCRCKEGYTGQQCERCADGYFGDPLKKGGSCEPCQCNGNIDRNLTGNCDPKSGKCFKCLKNTAGEKCEKCHIGYYGDAVKAKNCTSCGCASCGSAEYGCDQSSGNCVCKKNVMGRRCTKCKPNTWNYKACLGCMECDCKAASASKQCDIETGQCKCLPGVMGKKCDWCKLGYYGYSKDGCKKCNCPGKFCDVFTGSCDCGKTGEKCRICPDGHIITKDGCVRCDNCVQRLLQRVKVMDTNYSTQLNHSLGISKAKSLAIVNFSRQGLANRAASWSADLETTRKALGYGNYSEFDGHLGYHEVSEFVNCNFMHATATRMPTTHAAVTATTQMKSTAPTTAGHPSMMGKSNSKDACPASMARVFREIGFDKTSLLVNTLSNASKMVETNASATEDRAKRYLKDVKRFVKVVADAVHFANMTLERLMLGSNDTNVSVSEIRRIRNDLKARNFTTILIKLGVEKELAFNALVFTKDKLNKTMLQSLVVQEKDDLILSIANTFIAIDKGATDALYAAGNGSSLVDIAKAIDFQYFLDAAKRNIALYNISVSDAMMNATAAKMALDDAAAAFKQFGENSTTLNSLLVLLRKRVMELKDHNKNASAKVEEAKMHADSLSNQAAILESLIKDTRNFSDSAVRAATVYSNIVQAILEALAAAKEAETTALSTKLKALEALTQSQSLRNQSDLLKSDTNMLAENAQKLKMPLSEVRMHLDEIRALKERVKAKLRSVKEKFPQFDAAKETGKKAAETSEKAKNASMKARAAFDFSKEIKEKIDRAKTNLTRVANEIGNLNKLISEADAGVRQVESQVPTYNSSLSTARLLNKRIDDFIKSNILNSIKSIRYKIDNARSLVNRVPIATSFNGSASVSLRSPLVDGDNTNEMSMDIKTTQQDGLLMYIGDGLTPARRKRQAAGSDNHGNYLALSLVDGSVVFSARAGNLVSSVTSSTPVSDDKWYSINAARNFDLLYISVGPTEIAKRTTVQVETPGLSFIKLSKDSDVIVGGPPPGKKLPSDIANNFYEGYMEKVKINNVDSGLWNWEKQKDLLPAPQPQRRHTKPSMQFFGNGFLKYKPVSPQNAFRVVKFNFVTKQKDALLIYGPDELSGLFTSFEIVDGKLVYRYNNGYGISENVYKSTKMVNDNIVHYVIKSRTNLQLDGKVIATFDELSQELGGNMVFVGGVPLGQKMASSTIATTAFKGCFLSSAPTDLIVLFNQAVDSSTMIKFQSYKDIRLGCRKTAYQAASFDSPSSYLAINAEPCTLTEGKRFGFHFQTFVSRGVLLYGQGNAGADLSLIINKDGAVSMSVKSSPGNNGILVTDKKNLNDGKWHAVSVAHSGNKIILNVDGQAKEVSFNENIQLNGKMYFGGLPPSVVIDGITPFSLYGNIKNIFCDSGELDLAVKAVEKNKVTLAENVLPPLIKPTGQPITTAASPMTTPLATTEMVKSTGFPEPIRVSSTSATTKVTTSVPPSTSKSSTTEAVTTQKMTTRPLTTITEAPTTSTQAPMTTTEAPTTTTPAPTTTTQAPTTTTPAPTTTTGAPTTTTQAPTTTTQAPTTTTKAPTTTTEAPTTTTQAPTTTTKAPTTKPATCNASPNPTGEGFGFGLAPLSYKPFAVQSSKLEGRSKYSFLLSTTSANGILIISLNGKKSNFDYEIIYLEKGQIKYTFNAGSGPSMIVSKSVVNDGQWHMITTTRKARNGRLTIDGVTVSGKSPGSLSSMNSIIKVYVGGAPKKFPTFEKLPVATRGSIVGCIKDLKLNNKVLVSKEKDVGVTGCLSKYSGPGLFVGSAGGYGYSRKNVIKQVATVKITIKPRADSGIIYYIGKGQFDYLTIELFKGEVQVSVQNGAGQFEVAVPPAAGTTFCDGQAHEIIVEKVKAKVTVKIDSLPPKSAERKGASSVDTPDTAFFGGLPGNAKNVYGLRSRMPFRGCIINYTLNGKDRTSEIVAVGSAIKGCQ